MMQTNEVRQRLSEVENTIHDAARRCESTNGVPMAVKDSMQLLDQRIMQSNDMMQSQDESRIRQYIDDLEQIGDRAKDACENAPEEMDNSLRDVVMQAHRQLSDLKHQLH